MKVCQGCGSIGNFSLGFEIFANKGKDYYRSRFHGIMGSKHLVYQHPQNKFWNSRRPPYQKALFYDE